MRPQTKFRIWVALLALVLIGCGSGVQPLAPDPPAPQAPANTAPRVVVAVGPAETLLHRTTSLVFTVVDVDGDRLVVKAEGRGPGDFEFIHDRDAWFASGSQVRAWFWAYEPGEYVLTFSVSDGKDWSSVEHRINVSRRSIFG